jgi:hypothetical protein
MLVYVDKLIVKQKEYQLGSGRRQGVSGVGHGAIFWPAPYRQADAHDKPDKWLIMALERFANTSDSPESYLSLANAFPSFWPLPLEDDRGNDISWSPEGHQLFLFYRNLLRGFWTRNPEMLGVPIATSLLFGIMGNSEMQELISGKQLSSMALDKALSPLRFKYPGLRLPARPSIAVFWPDWATGSIEYASHLDFQRAAWLLFKESWRPKVCARCPTFFFAQKPAQLYCSLKCSRDVHRSSSLNWWRKKGSQKRAVRAKAKRRSGTVSTEPRPKSTKT